MELDLQLSRSGDEAWGFRLVGGVDYGLPLTVVKVFPNSPAERAGIQCGDTLSRLQGNDARWMSHDDAREVMSGADDTLAIGLQRGLYEPVLDDYEPIYEPVDQDDFDQPSQPTEVQFQIQSFTEVPNFTDKPLEYRDTPIRDSIPRSETASPIIVPLKPYRPFSTEPIPPNDVPPLENPIILNPDYGDVFSKHEGDEEFLPKTRFKLPISEQYDPDGTKSKQIEKYQETNEKRTIEGFKKDVSSQKKETFVGEVKKEIEFQQSKASNFEQISKEQTVTKELTFMEKNIQEINLQKIETTATSVVEDSIDKAITVAEEIKQEIDYELRGSTERTEVIESKQESNSIIESKHAVSETKEPKKETTVTTAEKFIDLIDKTTDEIIKQNGKKSVDVTKEIEMFEKIIEKEQSAAEKYSAKLENKKSVKKEDTAISAQDLQKSETKIDSKSVKTEKIQDTATKTSESTESCAKIGSQQSKDTKSKMSTSRLLKEQRAYTIGLQTIPQIRGSVHSSYHYNLLLKTFFIHLTDVMVALSRFILTEPTLPETKQEEAQQAMTENKTTETVHTETQSASQSMLHKDQIQTTSKKEVSALESEAKHVTQKEMLQEKVFEKVDEHQERLDVEVSKITDKRKISGAEMAQRTERKSAELTEKMGAVISEYQTKTGIEETEIKEESFEAKISEAKDVNLEAKSFESKTSESMIDTSSKLVSSSTSDSIIVTESQYEKKESKKKFKEGRPTYVAIVESHVYTNKDTILEEQFSGLTSETASVQSPGETQAALDFGEPQFTEISTESSQIKTESAKVAIEETNKMFVSSIEEAVNALEKLEVKHTETEVDMAVADSKVVIEEAKEMTVQEAIKPKEDLQEIKESIIHPDVLETSLIENKIVQNGVVSSNVQLKTENVNFQSQSYEDIMNKKVDSVQKFDEAEFQNIIVEQFESSSIKNELSSCIKEQSSIVEATTQQSEISEVITSEFQSKTAHEESMAAKTESIIATEEIITQQESTKEVKDEAAELKLTKKQVNDEAQNVEIREGSETIFRKETAINEQSQQMFEAHVTSLQEKTFDSIESSTQAQESSFTAKSVESNQILQEKTFDSIESSAQAQESSFTAKSVECNQILQERSFNSFESSAKVQESSFTAQSVESKVIDAKQLTLELNKQTEPNKLSHESSLSSIPSEIDTPTPSHIPPTPVTDEYVFKLEIPLPRSRGGTPYPREASPEPEVDEDPHIVKKKLIPHIDSPTIESKVFDPPLLTPPEDKLTPPVYTKPGLRGGGVLRKHKKEEIREIERKSSLLASAIDETIKNIELYKQQVAQESKRETETLQTMKLKSSENSSLTENGQIIYNGYAKIDHKVYENGDAQVKEVVTVGDAARERAASSDKIIDVTSRRDVGEVAPIEETKEDPIQGYKPVPFNPDDIVHMTNIVPPVAMPEPEPHEVYKTATGEVLGSKQGIVDGLEDNIVKSEVAEELGRPGMTEDKIAALISGESEMLREAHVMGLSRVLKSHMHRDNDDSSVDFKKIKPIIESLKDSEVLKALNDELIKTKEEKKKEERKWTTFMQKPRRPVPKAKFGYPGWTSQEEEVEAPYTVKIVKQPKPKVAPDYKPEDFNTGPLPWEERALNEPPQPPVEAEEPILVPEETPEFLEAVDPLPESEVPDLEDTGIPLPPPKEEQIPASEEQPEDNEPGEPAEEQETEVIVEETEKDVEEMEASRVAEQLMSVSSIVDPNAPLDQQLKQMQAQIAALANLPCVIQQTLEMVTKQLSQMTSQETFQRVTAGETGQVTEVTDDDQVAESKNADNCTTIEELNEEETSEAVVQNGQPEESASQEQVETKPTLSEEEMTRLKKEELEMLEEQQRIEKQKKELMDQMRVELEGRQVKQRPTPRVGKPAPMFGPLTPQERPVVLPGGRKWRKPKDAYNEQFIAETLSAQAEIIQGKAKGINFMKFEKPPVSLDHLQHSDTYKLIHNMEQEPARRIDVRTPAYSESDYREKCRSMTPCHGSEQHISIPQQVQP